MMIEHLPELLFVAHVASNVSAFSSLSAKNTQ
jgi:hypothetical protein